MLSCIPPIGMIQSWHNNGSRGELNGYNRNISAEIKPFSKPCHETRAPVLVTKNGEADLVVMSFSASQKMVARYRLGQMLSEVDREIAQGKPMRDFEDTFAALL
jgi:PHD/YefM family antitoxin component YafN of YafNO toxin-antitoxin module